MKRRGIDWRKVASLFRAREPEDLVRCPSCKAEGVVPYVAEHVLRAHRASPLGRRIAQIVLEDTKQRSS